MTRKLTEVLEEGEVRESSMPSLLKEACLDGGLPLHVRMMTGETFVFSGAAYDGHDWIDLHECYKDSGKGDGVQYRIGSITVRLSAISWVREP